MRSFLSPSAVPVLLASLAFVSLGLPDGLLGVSWPSIRDEFGLPLDAMGALVAGTVAGYLASSFFTGAILRAVPLGTVLAASTASTATALLGFSLAPSWLVMIGLSLLAGIGGGAIDASLNAYGARRFSPRMLNWLHAFFGVGTTVGPLIATAVLGSGLAWRWSYALVGVAQAALAVTFLLTRRRWVEDAKAVADKASVPAARSAETLRRPDVWLGMLVFFLYAGLELATAQWSYTLFTLGRGVTEAAAGLFVTLYWGALTLGRIAFGFIADRVRLELALRLCLFSASIGAFLLYVGGGALSVVGLVTIGFSFAPVMASLISLTPSRVGSAHADSAVGFQIASAALGAAAVTGGVGLAADAYGLEAIGLSILALTVTLLALYERLVRWSRMQALRPAC